MNYNIICKTALTAVLVLGFSGNASANECYYGAPGWCLKSGFDDSTPLTGTMFSIDDQGWMELGVNGVKQVYITDFIVAERALDPITGAETGLSPPPLAMADYLLAIDPFGGGIPPLIYLDWGISFSVTQPAPNQLTMTGLPVSTWGSIDLSFEVIDTTGDPTIASATLIETFTLTNRSTETKDMSVFSYTDLDVSGGPGEFGAIDDQGELISWDHSGNPIAYRQFDALNQMIASVDVAPDHYEVGMGTNCQVDMCQRVYEGNNGFDVMLADTIDPGVGDLNMAAQYVRTLAPGESMTFTQTIMLNTVPVPAAAWLFGSGLIGLIGVARRKQSVTA